MALRFGGILTIVMRLPFFLGAMIAKGSFCAIVRVFPCSCISFRVGAVSPIRLFRRPLSDFVDRGPFGVGLSHLWSRRARLDCKWPCVFNRERCRPLDFSAFPLITGSSGPFLATSSPPAIIMLNLLRAHSIRRAMIPPPWIYQWPLKSLHTMISLNLSRGSRLLRIREKIRER